MDFTKLIVLGLIIILIVGINFSLIMALLRGKTSRDIDMYGKLAGRLRDPWQDENQDLQELSRLVQGLREQSDPENLEKDSSPEAEEGSQLNIL